MALDHAAPTTPPVFILANFLVPFGCLIASPFTFAQVPFDSTSLLEGTIGDTAINGLDHGDFTRMAEGEKEIRWIGVRLLGLIGEVFRLWHLYKAGKCDRADLKRWSRPLRERIFELLDKGALSEGGETSSMCRGIMRTEPSMWTFIEHEGIEPTNNVAE